MRTGTTHRKRIIGRAVAHLVPDGENRARCGQTSGVWIDSPSSGEDCAQCALIDSGQWKLPGRTYGMPLADGHRELLLALSLAADSGLQLSNHDADELKWLRTDRMAVQFAGARGTLRWRLTGRGAEALQFNRYLRG